MSYYVSEEKFVATHPGEILSEKLEEMGMSIKEFAVRTAKPEQTVIAILNGNSSITPDMAVGFETVLHIKADTWLKMQCLFDEYKARKKREALIAETETWTRKFPYMEMSRKRWLPQTANVHERSENLLAYFGVSTPKSWEDYYMHQKLKVAFSISLSSFSDPYAMSAWLRQGELQCDKMSVAKAYSEAEVKGQIPQLVSDLSAKVNDVKSLFSDFCSRNGICLIETSSLPHLKVLGALRWIKGIPCIQLASNHKSAKQLCRVFFHELGHLVLHGKKEIFIEFDNKSILPGYRQKEREAEKFANKILESIFE